MQLHLSFFYMQETIWRKSHNDKNKEINKNKYSPFLKYQLMADWPQQSIVFANLAFSVGPSVMGLTV